MDAQCNMLWVIPVEFFRQGLLYYICKVQELDMNQNTDHPKKTEFIYLSKTKII